MHKCVVQLAPILTFVADDDIQDSLGVVWETLPQNVQKCLDRHLETLAQAYLSIAALINGIPHDWIEPDNMLRPCLAHWAAGCQTLDGDISVNVGPPCPRDETWWTADTRILADLWVFRTPRAQTTLGGKRASIGAPTLDMTSLVAYNCLECAPCVVTMLCKMVLQPSKHADKFQLAVTARFQDMVLRQCPAGTAMSAELLETYVGQMRNYVCSDRAPMSDGEAYLLAINRLVLSNLNLSEP